MNVATYTRALTRAGWPITRATSYVANLLTGAERLGLNGPEREVVVSMASRAAARGWLVPLVFTARHIDGRITSWRSVDSGQGAIESETCPGCESAAAAGPHTCQPVLATDEDLVVIQYSHPVLAALGLDAWHAAGSEEDALTHRLADVLRESAGPGDGPRTSRQIIDLATRPVVRTSTVAGQADTPTAALREAVRNLGLAAALTIGPLLAHTRGARPASVTDIRSKRTRVPAA